MNHVIKRISLIAAEPCDGYTCPCADCQQYRLDLIKANYDLDFEDVYNDVANEAREAEELMLSQTATYNWECPELDDADLPF